MAKLLIGIAAIIQVILIAWITTPTYAKDYTQLFEEIKSANYNMQVELIDKNFDIDKIAKQVAGRSLYHRATTKRDKENYHKIFRQYFTNRIIKIISDDDITILDQIIKSPITVITGIINKITFIVKVKDDKVMDISVANISIMDSLRVRIKDYSRNNDGKVHLNNATEKLRGLI